MFNSVDKLLLSNWHFIINLNQLFSCEKKTEKIKWPIFQIEENRLLSRCQHIYFKFKICIPAGIPNWVFNFMEVDSKKNYVLYFIVSW